jgi:hypothetical protein
MQCMFDFYLRFDVLFESLPRLVACVLLVFGLFYLFFL